jgi:hypothetical protein
MACNPGEVSDPMADVLKAYAELKEAEAAADALVRAARVNFGRAMHEARSLPRSRRVKQDDIVAKVGLKRERLRQIEQIYTDSLVAAES